MHFNRMNSGRAIPVVMFVLAAVLTLAGGEVRAASAGCTPDWSNTIGQPGLSGAGASSGIGAIVAGTPDFDPGALYVAGAFTMAGNVPANSVARWDGSQWSALGSGVSFFGSVGGIHALAIHDDGSGPALYAGGLISHAGGVPAHNVARWNGTSWSAVGSGIAEFGNQVIGALAVFDDGSGPALYAGGIFSSDGQTTTQGIVKWNGSSWSLLGSGVGEGGVSSLLVHNDGSGPALYVGGAFSTFTGGPGNAVAKWNGTSWSSVGLGMFGAVYALAGDSAGTLYAGGDFPILGPIHAPTQAGGIAQWNGSTWTPMGTGMDDGEDIGGIRALAVFDDGDGEALYAGGHFISAGGEPISYIARWDQSTQKWLPLGAGVDGDVAELAVTSVGSGPPALYVGGAFTTAGGLPSNSIAKWGGCGGPGEPTNPADIDGNGVVNVWDLLALIGAWGPCANCSPGACPGDIDGNCTVNVWDLLLLIQNWG